jgi:hypothetical protein
VATVAWENRRREKTQDMFETKGKITSISPFSETHEQITIQIAVPEPLGEAGETRENDLIVPKGSHKVGDIVAIVIKSA